MSVDIWISRWQIWQKPFLKKDRTNPRVIIIGAPNTRRFRSPRKNIWRRFWEDASTRNISPELRRNAMAVSKSVVTELQGKKKFRKSFFHRWKWHEDEDEDEVHEPGALKFSPHPHLHCSTWENSSYPCSCSSTFSSSSSSYVHKSPISCSLHYKFSL